MLDILLRAEGARGGDFDFGARNFSCNRDGGGGGHGQQGS